MRPWPRPCARRHAIAATSSAGTARRASVRLIGTPRRMPATVVSWRAISSRARQSHLAVGRRDHWRYRPAGHWPQLPVSADPDPIRQMLEDLHGATDPAFGQALFGREAAANRTALDAAASPRPPSQRRPNVLKSRHIVAETRTVRRLTGPARRSWNTAWGDSVQHRLRALVENAVAEWQNFHLADLQFWHRSEARLALLGLVAFIGCPADHPLDDRDAGPGVTARPAGGARPIAGIARCRSCSTCRCCCSWSACRSSPSRWPIRSPRS